MERVQNGCHIVRTIEDMKEFDARIYSAAERTTAAIMARCSDPLALFRDLKFADFGQHPVEERPLNVIEQVNQTASYAAAAEAARFLLERHPDAGGLSLAPGAHRAQDLDIMSLNPNVLGAEVFAAVLPGNNRKLATDLDKLEARTHVKHRYLFFASPLHPYTRRLPAYERSAIEVWSVKIFGLPSGTLPDAASPLSEQLWL